MEIFKLFGTILVDNTKANDSISKTEEKAEGLGSKLGAGIVTAGKWGMAIAGGVSIVGGAVAGMVMKVTDSMSAIEDSSQRAGMSAEEYQKFAYAAKLSGVEAESLEKLMIKQQKAFTDAAEGGTAASEAYERLGIDITNISSGEAFDQVLAKLADSKDITERNAIANDIFGKSYAELTPLLNEGSAGIAALKAEAEAMGGVMSNESVASAEAFGDTLDTLKTAMGGVFNKVGSELMPIFQNLADWLLENMPEIQEFVGKAFDVISTAIGVAYEWFNTYLLPIFKSLFAWVQENMPMIQSVIGYVFGAISEIVKSVWKIFSENLIPILKALWDFISPTFPLIQGAIKLAFDAVVTTVQTVVDIFDKVTGAIKTAVDWLTQWNDKPVKKKDVSKGGGSNSVSANGLEYVPFDGFNILAHKGERLLTAEESKQYSNQSNGSKGNTMNVSVNVRSPYDVVKELSILDKKLAWGL